MKTKTINVYQYSELSERAKERARQWFLKVQELSFQWECMKDNAKNFGIKLHGTHNGSMEGELILDFTQVMSAIIAEHGDTCETYKTAKEYQERYMALTEEQEEEKEELEQEFLNSILEDYRIMSEKEEEYCQSEEYINECMEANEYEFDEDGRRI